MPMAESPIEQVRRVVKAFLNGDRSSAHAAFGAILACLEDHDARLSSSGVTAGNGGESVSGDRPGLPAGYYFVTGCLTAEVFAPSERMAVRVDAAGHFKFHGSMSLKLQAKLAACLARKIEELNGE